MTEFHSLRVVLGSPASIEDAFIERVSTLRESDALAPVDVLVGGVLIRPYLQRLIAEATPGLVNIRFSTIGELGIRLGEPTLASAGRRPLPAMAERAYVAEVAGACSGYFAPVAGTPGFAEASRRLLRELRQARVSPNALAAAAGEIESEAKASDLCDLYRRYLDGRAGYYDGEDALAAADPGRFDGAELLVLGLWRLNATARDLVRRIAERVGVTVFLPSIEEDVDEVHADLRSWLRELGADTVTLPRRESGSALGNLQARLFATELPVALDGTVELVSAPDPLSETKGAARACLTWAAAGVPFRQMVVAYRQAEVYRPLVEAIFGEAGIPVYLDDGPSLAERPLGRRILGLIDLIDSPLRRPDVMAFLSDGRMPRATRDRFGGARVARWDSASRRAGVVQGLEQWRERLSRLRDDERAAAEQEDAPEWLAQRVEDCEMLLAFVEELSGRIAALPARSSWTEALAHIRALLVEYIDGADDVLGYLETLNELDAIIPEIEFVRFLDILRAEVRAMKAGDLDEGVQGAFGRRGVNVLDVNQLRHLRFQGVCVLGLTERTFPPPPRQDPLLLDEERERLNAACGLTLPLRARGADPEPLQFALAVHAARERLFLSTRRAEEAGGRAQLPSAFFRAAISAIEGRRVRVDEVERAACVRRLPAGRVGSADLEGSLTLAERDRTLLEQQPELGRAVLARLEPRAERAGLLRDARWRTRELTVFDGIFVGVDALGAAARAFEDGRALSATGLERYAVCPYQYFLGNVLRLRPLAEPADIVRIDALDRGSLVHAILRDFVRALGETRLDADDPVRHRATLEQITQAALADAQARGRTGTPLLWSADRKAILDDLVGWLERELADPGPFTTRALEVAFGEPWSEGPESPPSSAEPLRLPLGDRELRLQGRIDRLDYDAERFRVVDYKTGSAPGGKDASLDGGRTLQLPLYLLAGAALLGLDRRRGEAAYHVVSRRGRFRRIAFSGADLEARYGDLESVLGRIAEGIAGGDFHVEPDPQSCRWCDFDGLCDVGRARIRERKQADERIQTFVDMRRVE